MEFEDGCVYFWERRDHAFMFIEILYSKLEISQPSFKAHILEVKMALLFFLDPFRYVLMLLDTFLMHIVDLIKGSR